MAEALTEMQKKKKTRFPISRVKKLIQQNEDIGKTSATVPVVLSKSVELLFDQLIDRMIGKALERKSTKIQMQDFRAVIEDHAAYAFMKDACKETAEE